MLQGTSFQGCSRTEDPGSFFGGEAVEEVAAFLVEALVARVFGAAVSISVSSPLFR